MSRRFVFWLAVIGACSLTMAVSYQFSLSTLRKEPAYRASSAGLSQATRIRRFSNELLRLTGEYLSEVPRDEGPISERTERWLASEFRPRLNDLRQRMMASPGPSTALAELLAAADRVTAMVIRPNDFAPRGPAANAVLDACAYTEQTIAAMGLQRNTTPPAIVPGFRRYAPSSRRVIQD